MKTIDIFGDSFSHYNSRYTSDITWLDILNEKYEIKNFSLDGVGAHYCIEKFMELEEYSDFLLFMIPDLNRLNLEYIKDKSKQSECSIIFKQMESGSYDFPEYFDEEVVDKSEKIFRDYLGFYNSELHKILEPLMVQYVFSRANYYKKILVWASSGLGYPFLYNNNIIIPDNCYIVEGSLNRISYNELKEKNLIPEKIFGKDKRNNHLHIDNHKVLAQSIDNYFQHDDKPNSLNFYTDISSSGE